MAVIIDNHHEKLHRLNRRIGLALRIMTSVCLLLLMTGMIMYLITGISHPIEITPFPTQLNDLLAFSPAGITMAGLLLVLLMPLVILFISFIHFIAEKDIKLITVCIVLILMLVTSCVLILNKLTAL